LRIEAVGATVLSAALGTGVAADFQCRQEDCKSISIGKRDARGVRVIALNNTALARTSAGGTTSAAGSATLTGKLLTVPEESLAGACAEQGVSIVASDGSSAPFCPKGGAGFEIAEDGSKVYRFMNLDGESILIAVDQRHRVQSVEYRGDTSVSCSAVACGGVYSSAASANGERTFTFVGTTLADAANERIDAVLNGTLIVPSL
jgi:hypothetical protein